MADLIKISAPGIAQVLKDLDTFEAKTKAIIHAELKASIQTIV